MRHCAFLIGCGHSSGDPGAAPQSVEQVVRLLRIPPPWKRDLDTVFATLKTGSVVPEWPLPETEREDHLFTAATLVFVQPAQSHRARQALHRALGGNRFEYLMGLLASIRTAHYWTVIHPELASEPDVQEMLFANHELAVLLLQAPELPKSV